MLMDDGVTGILLAHLRAFGSGELKTNLVCWPIGYSSVYVRKHGQIEIFSIVGFENNVAEVITVPQLDKAEIFTLL